MVRECILPCHETGVTAIMKRLIRLSAICLAIGYGVGSINDRTASGEPVPISNTVRYAISSYGPENQRGCYVVDTSTGDLWLAGSAGRIVSLGNVPAHNHE
jgi:hypothetical protein